MNSLHAQPAFYLSACLLPLLLAVLLAACCLCRLLLLDDLNGRRHRPWLLRVKQNVDVRVRAAVLPGLRHELLAVQHQPLGRRAGGEEAAVRARQVRVDGDAEHLAVLRRQHVFARRQSHADARHPRRRRQQLLLGRRRRRNPGGVAACPSGGGGGGAAQRPPRCLTRRLPLPLPLLRRRAEAAAAASCRQHSVCLVVVVTMSMCVWGQDGRSAAGKNKTVDRPPPTANHGTTEQKRGVHNAQRLPRLTGGARLCPRHNLMQD